MLLYPVGTIFVLSLMQSASLSEPQFESSLLCKLKKKTLVNLIFFFFFFFFFFGIMQTDYYITKTYLYNFDPLKSHFYIVKLGFTGAYIIFLIPAQNIDCGYSLEPPHRGGSNEYPQSMF